MFRILRSRGIQRPVMQVWGSEDPTVSFEQAMGLYRILARKGAAGPLAGLPPLRPLQLP